MVIRRLWLSIEKPLIVLWVGQHCLDHRLKSTVFLHFVMNCSHDSIWVFNSITAFDDAVQLFAFPVIERNSVRFINVITKWVINLDSKRDKWDAWIVMTRDVWRSRNVDLESRTKRNESLMWSAQKTVWDKNWSLSVSSDTFDCSDAEDVGQVSSSQLPWNGFQLIYEKLRQ